MPRAPGRSAPQPVPPTPGFIQLGLFEPTASGKTAARWQKGGDVDLGVVVVFVAVLTGGLVLSLLLDWP